jgi:hypothetical protein
VKWLDALAGRSRPKAPRLDGLFQVPSAAITLQVSMGLTPTGDGAVCYKAGPGAGGAQVREELLGVIATGENPPAVHTSVDSFGFTWLEIDHDPIDPANPDLGDLVTGLHAVNTTLEMSGYGPGLLCTLIPFVGADGRRLGLVYLYKQGTFYPFAPMAGQQRDNLLELQVRDQLSRELTLEQDLSRWMALWGAPGL